MDRGPLPLLSLTLCSPWPGQDNTSPAPRTSQDAGLPSLALPLGPPAKVPALAPCTCDKSYPRWSGSRHASESDTRPGGRRCWSATPHISPQLNSRQPTCAKLAQSPAPPHALGTPQCCGRRLQPTCHPPPVLMLPHRAQSHFQVPYISATCGLLSVPTVSPAEGSTHPLWVPSVTTPSCPQSAATGLSVGGSQACSDGQPFKPSPPRRAGTQSHARLP